MKVERIKMKKINRKIERSGNVKKMDKEMKKEDNRVRRRLEKIDGKMRRKNEKVKRRLEKIDRRMKGR
jgi:flagellar capping protein FliD